MTHKQLQCLNEQTSLIVLSGIEGDSKDFIPPPIYIHVVFNGLSNDYHKICQINHDILFQQ